MKLAEKHTVSTNSANTKIAPERLISEYSGQPEYGHFDSTVDSLAVEDFHYYTEMDKPASKLAKYFHFKQFQFINIVTPRFVIGVALADIRYVGSAFCYLYDIEKNRLLESSWLRPLGLGYKMSSSPSNGKASISGGKGSIEFNIVSGQWHLQLNTLQISASLEFSSLPLSLPMAMCAPCGYRGWTYTQKHNGLKVKGELVINHESQPLNQALGGYDFSAGFMRRETSWRWASINAHIAEGIMGLNLAAGVNETGINENVFWINGERHLLGPVHFDFDRHSDDEPQWHIYSDDGRVDLVFTPKNCRKEKLNLWLIKSNFRQYIGHYTGTIRDSSGNQYQLKSVLGLSEDHFAKW